MVIHGEDLAIVKDKVCRFGCEDARRCHQAGHEKDDATGKLTLERLHFATLCLKVLSNAQADSQGKGKSLLQQPILPGLIFFKISVP